MLARTKELEKIRQDHPEVNEKFLQFRNDVRTLVKEIRDLVGTLPEEDRELVRILVINGIHRMTDEVFLEVSENS